MWMLCRLFAGFFLLPVGLIGVVLNSGTSDAYRPAAVLLGGIIFLTSAFYDMYRLLKTIEFQTRRRSSGQR